MKTVVFANQKGGVAKSTSAFGLGMGLYHRGKRVLFVDADPQSNLTHATGADAIEGDHWTLYDVIFKKCELKDAIRFVNEKTDIISIGLEGTKADIDLASKVSREYIFKKILKPLQKTYDVCVIDSPPSLGVISLNCLTAADCLIVPLNLDYFSLQGLSQLQGFYENVKENTNEALSVAGLLITKHKQNLRLSKELGAVVVDAANSLGTFVYDTTIREAAAIREAQLLSQDFFVTDPKCKAVIDYSDFVTEFLDKEGL